MRILSLEREESGLSKIRGYRTRMLSLWLQERMFWVSEQRLVDRANTFRWNSCMIELEMEDLEKR